MTDSNKTLVAGLLDRTGSMSSSKQATEEGWAELVEEQKKQPGECLVTLAQFDLPGGFYGVVESGPSSPTEIVEWVYINTPVADVPEFVLTPRGSTPLYDAVGIFVTEIGKQLAALPESQRPGTVILVLMTDGGENASQTWTQRKVHDLITEQREKYDWKVMFLGANIDAVQVGTGLGVAANSSIQYDSHDHLSNRAVYRAAGVYTSALRGPEVAVAAAAGFSEDDRAASMGKSKSKDKSRPGKGDDSTPRARGAVGSSR